MPYLITFLVGVAIGALSGVLVYRNNKARLADLEQELRAAHLTIENLYHHIKSE